MVVHIGTRSFAYICLERSLVKGGVDQNRAVVSTVLSFGFFIALHLDGVAFRNVASQSLALLTFVYSTSLVGLDTILVL